MRGLSCLLSFFITKFSKLTHFTFDLCEFIGQHVLRVVEVELQCLKAVFSVEPNSELIKLILGHVIEVVEVVMITVSNHDSHGWVVSVVRLILSADDVLEQLDHFAGFKVGSGGPVIAIARYRLFEQLSESVDKLGASYGVTLEGHAVVP